MAEDNMGEFSTPKSMMHPDGMRPMPGPGLGVIFMDRSQMKGAGQLPTGGRFVHSNYTGSFRRGRLKTFAQTYEETYENVKRKHKWLPNPLIKAWARLTSIPRHILRHSLENMTYNPKYVSDMEKEYGNKI